MATDSELVERLREFLRTSDLTTTTNAIVRRKLEEEFGIDLTEKKLFIREQVDLYLRTQIEKSEGEEVEREDENAEDKALEEEPNKVEEDEEEEQEEEEEEEEERSGGKGRKKAVTKINKDVKKRGGGFSKLCSLSPQLQNFVGVPELARTEVVKQLWAYIREKNLQDPNNRRNIICDEALRGLFHVEVINMFQMNKALSKHIWPLESEDGGTSGAAKPTQKEKQQKQVKREGPNEPKSKEKRQRGGGSGFLAPLPLSDALMKFIGTGESELSRGDVVKKIWDYIKQNNLQDPSDKRRIICDDKLKELFEVDSFHGFTVPKLLSAHFVKSEQ
ncbi:hypothetical protein Scep_000470 [Stephania cephalantha]|uniref:Upstream activation factor subunit spp27 n=1 Tax=Stephania cephalantha TaxID=152367 RepID=A0AAP0Q468_9MAGN